LFLGDSNGGLASVAGKQRRDKPGAIRASVSRNR
jgi:hypothetical protein